MWELLKSMAGHFLVMAILMGGMLLLFTNLRFDYAAYLFVSLIAGFAVFVYWPRKRPKSDKTESL